ncbi:MAG: hypothetical protein HUU19_02005 [Phycisphaerales bacterium]|nr:hypothetical protein [Phycisphaerales bacterium]
MNAKHAVMLFGLLGTMNTLAKPPLQLSGPGVRVEPLAIAPARIEHGKFVLGEWQEYQATQTRGAKGYYYIFDCFGGWVDPELGRRGYVNHARSGLGAEPGEPRVPWDTMCGSGSSRWYFGPEYLCPMTVDDIESLAPGAPGGSPIDGVDAAWWWGGGECVLAFFPSDDSALCDDGDPLDHTYAEGVVVDVGDQEPGGYYYVNVDGIWSQHGVLVPTPRPGGSYLAGLLNKDGSPNLQPGTQFMLWGTSDANSEPFRSGTQSSKGWDDDAPIDAHFSPSECYDYSCGICTCPLGRMVGFLAYRCPADLNWDGFVNGDDYDLFAEWFDGCASPWYCDADLNGDGYANGDDFDAFASWFDEGC